MSTYRFVGSECMLGDGTSLSQFGQAVELEDELAQELIARNVALLPATVWAQTAITDLECQQYSSIALHSESPEFCAKRDRAWMLLHEYRMSLSSAPAAKEE